MAELKAVQNISVIMQLQFVNILLLSEVYTPPDKPFSVSEIDFSPRIVLANVRDIVTGEFNMSWKMYYL